jgi:hypothetical protein
VRFFSGFAVAILAVSSWEWAWPAAAVIGIAVFWRDLGELAGSVHRDFEIAHARKQVNTDLHASVDARTAWELFHV